VSEPDRNKPRPAGAPKTLQAGDTEALNMEVMRRVRASYLPVLIVLAGDQVGQRIGVERTLIIGRDPEAGLTLTDSLASWHHARIEDRGDSWTLVDLGSTNGTFVNGERVEEETALKPNDRVAFGNTIVSFELQDSVTQAYGEVVERMLNIDDLSGLLVRRKFDLDFSAMVDAARVQSEPLGLLVMDLDGVKRINDTHGHLFGAYVIGEAGRLIGRITGERGIACRFGGDEYLAALPGCDGDRAAAVGEEIRIAVAEHRFERDGIVLRPGISVGVAALPDDGTEPEALFQRADEALYRAKQAGKNRVCR
jgi:diguanylate cyclase (GGDEF)-like protein